MSASYQFITPSGQNPNLIAYSAKVGLNFKNVFLFHLAYYGFSEEECCRTLIPDSYVLSSESSSANTLLQSPASSLHLAFPALGSCNAQFFDSRVQKHAASPALGSCIPEPTPISKLCSTDWSVELWPTHSPWVVL